MMFYSEMIAVSSHKPGCELHHAAHRTWSKTFDYCVYFGDPEPELNSPQTAFIHAEPFPTIYTLAEFCSQQPGWSAIINADIFLASNFRKVAEYYIARDFLAAVSARYQFDYKPNHAPEDGRMEDLGLDVFIAEQQIWKKVCEELPPLFRIGRILWDTWMVGFFIAHCGNKLADLSPWHVVFHPRHIVSPQRNAIEWSYSDKYIASARWPLPQYHEQPRLTATV